MLIAWPHYNETFKLSAISFVSTANQASQGIIGQLAQIEALILQDIDAAQHMSAALYANHKSRALPPDSVIRLLLTHGKVLWSAGQYPLAIRAYNQALKKINQHSIFDCRAEVLLRRGITQFSLKRYLQAMEDFVLALEIAVDVIDLEIASECYLYIGSLYAIFEKNAAADELLRLGAQIAEVLGELLADQYDVRFAMSASQALVRIAQAQPDLILLDIMMPEMDGYELCRILRQDPATAEIPVIFITALATADEETRGLDAGAVDYIVKPFNPAIVRARVRNHLALKLAKDQLRVLARTDALTGLANRRYLIECLMLEFERARDDAVHPPFSLVLMDVDYFKLYNDSQGHVAGDYCLQRVAGVIQSALRNPNDLLARYGGEEFCCLLPNTTQFEAQQIAERICSSVAELAIPHPKAIGRSFVTLSAGVAHWRADVMTMEKLLHHADQALYLAKEAGRNQVVVAV